MMSLPQPRIYRLRKCDNLFFLETPPFLRPEIPHCEDISRNFELMQFLLQQAAVQDNKPWPLTTRKMVDAALRLKSLPTLSLLVRHTQKISFIHHHHFCAPFMIFSLVIRINVSTLYLTHDKSTSSKEDFVKV